MLRNVTLIKAVSSCWESGKDSAEAALSPNYVLCLPALGHASWAEIRKEEENISLIPSNSLKKDFRDLLLLLGCTIQTPPPFFFSSFEGTKLFFNNGGGSLLLLLQGSCSERYYLTQRAILLATDCFHVSKKFDLDVTNFCCCKDTFGSGSLHYHSIGSREENMSNTRQKKVEQTRKKNHILLRHLQLEYLVD